MRAVISLAAALERSASLRTSSATTANPKSVLTGPSRLDRGVQGQQVGLAGNLTDDLDDITDLLARLLDQDHGLDGLLNGFTPLLGQLRGLLGLRTGRRRALRLMSTIE